MSLYRNILAQALKITWKNKYLWFFGLFAALLGNGGEFEIIYRGFDSDSDFFWIFAGFKKAFEKGFFSMNTLHNIGQLAVNDPLNLFLVVTISLVVLILVIFLIWLTVISQAVLVNNSAYGIAGKDHNFKEGLAIGIKKFWPIFGLNCIIRVIIYGAMAVVSLPILGTVTNFNPGKSSLIFIISFLILIPAAIVLSLIMKYSIAYVVIKGNKFIESIRFGWQLFLKNWLISLEMAMLLFAINFLVGLCLILAMLIVSVPFIFIILILAKLSLFFNFWTVIFLALVFFLIAIALVGAVLATFQVSAWTSLFIELVGRGGVSKLVRIFEKKSN